MDIEKDNLPDDPELLKKMLTDLAVKYESLDEKYIYLDEKYKTLQRMLFGKKSEKLTEEDENQMRFFNEAEEGAADSDDPGENSPGETASKTTEVKSYTRTKGGRKPLPEHLHREEIIH
ncbi:MAG: IS66 family transposase, partial [Desulfobacteraceae bacterium]|nr:IS66 family transposase [Desulfobacteraceae bacterium]